VPVALARPCAFPCDGTRSAFPRRLPLPRPAAIARFPGDRTNRRAGDIRARAGTPVLPAAVASTRVMRLGELVRCGLYQLPELPPAGPSAEALTELTDRRAAERGNGLLRRQLAGALAERDAARVILAANSAEIARLIGWVDTLLKGAA